MEAENNKFPSNAKKPNIISSIRSNTTFSIPDNKPSPEISNDKGLMKPTENLVSVKKLIVSTLFFYANEMQNPNRELEQLKRIQETMPKLDYQNTSTVQEAAEFFICEVFSKTKQRSKPNLLSKLKM